VLENTESRASKANPSSFATVIFIGGLLMAKTGQDFSASGSQGINSLVKKF
jgi:hypothetical protein